MKKPSIRSIIVRAPEFFELEVITDFIIRAFIAIVIGYWLIGLFVIERKDNLHEILTQQNCIFKEMNESEAIFICDNNVKLRLNDVTLPMAFQYAKTSNTSKEGQ